MGGFTDCCVNRRSSMKEWRDHATPSTVKDGFGSCRFVLSTFAKSFEAVPLANAIVYIVSSLRLGRIQKLVRH